MAKFNPSGTALIYSTYLGGIGRGHDALVPARPYRGRCRRQRLRRRRHELGQLPDRRRRADTTYGGGIAESERRVLREARTDRRVPLRHLHRRHRLRLDHGYRGRQRPATSTSAAARRRTPAASRRRRTPTTHREQLRRVPDQVRCAGTCVYSTFLGGIGGEQLPAVAGGLAIDDQGRAYVTGDTYSTDFPIVNGSQTTSAAARYDVFLAVIDTTQAGAAGLVYSTYLGGTGTDMGMGIAYAGNRSGRSRREADPGFPTAERVRSPRTTAATATRSSPSSTRRRPAPRRCSSRPSRRSIYDHRLGRRRGSQGDRPLRRRDASTDFPQVAADLDARQPDAAVRREAERRGHGAAVLVLLRGRRQRQGTMGGGHQRRRRHLRRRLHQQPDHQSRRRRPASRSPTRARGSSAAAARTHSCRASATAAT